MCKSTRLGGCGVNLAAMDLARTSPGVRVEEDRELAAAERLGDFRRELVAGHYFHLTARERRDQIPGYMPAEPVITAQRIPVTDNQRLSRHSALHALFSSSTTAPSAPSNWMRRGIWPEAWVEQLKQG